MSRPRPTRSSCDGLAREVGQHVRERAADPLGDVAVDLLAVQAAHVVGLEDLLRELGGHSVAHPTHPRRGPRERLAPARKARPGADTVD